MAFKDMCCGLCAWFSVIGSVMFITMSYMLLNKNRPLIEHKFKMPFYNNDPEIDAQAHKMMVMSIIMIVAALGCFVGQCSYARKEVVEEEERKERQHREYNVIFKNEVGRPVASGLPQSSHVEMTSIN
mmetsp:Transcript_6062/g.9768  ORF Transcript_6062/g.9768 Transcript_6062/m.9768 type:complete len:128 (-) Transcript_6062:37-420(-)